MWAGPSCASSASPTRSRPFDRALSVSLGSHQGQVLVHLRGVRAIARWQLLDLDGALEEIEAAEEGAWLNRDSHQVVIAAWLRTMAHHHRGEADAAERAAEEFARLARDHPRGALIHNAAANVATIHIERDPERAVREMIAAAGRELERTDHYWGCALHLALVRASIAMGRLEDAERWAAKAATRDCGLGLPASDVRATLARAELLLAQGRPRAAAEAAGHAVAAADRIPAPMDAADGLLLAGRALAAAGEVEKAKAAPAARGCRRRPRRRAAAAQRRPARAAPPRHARLGGGRGAPCAASSPSASAASPSSCSSGTRTSRWRRRCSSARRRCRTR
jgi:tetratricopeptide (TPR) repeat protein